MLQFPSKKVDSGCESGLQGLSSEPSEKLEIVSYRCQFYTEIKKLKKRKVYDQDKLNLNIQFLHDTKSTEA